MDQGVESPPYSISAETPPRAVVTERQLTTEHPRTEINTDVEERNDAKRIEQIQALQAAIGAQAQNLPENHTFQVAQPEPLVIKQHKSFFSKISNKIKTAWNWTKAEVTAFAARSIHIFRPPQNPPLTA